MKQDNYVNALHDRLLLLVQELKQLTDRRFKRYGPNLHVRAEAALDRCIKDLYKLRAEVGGTDE